MSAPEVKVTVFDDTGDIEIEVDGAKGKDCLAMAADFEKVFKVEERKLKPEFNERGTTKQQQGLRRG
jgi:hypothetical protein